MPQDYVNLPAAIGPASAVETYRTSTNAADLCGSIVKATAKDIQGRKYVCVEGWQAIAVAHGCAATSCSVERVEGGVRAIGQVRRMDTGAVIAEAEGFVGEDEPVWFGGEAISFGKRKTYQKRPDFAIRAMAQTRAISRACRSAFAHVVVLIDKDLGTTPAEEMMGVIDHEPNPAPQQNQSGPTGTAAGGTDFRPERRSNSMRQFQGEAEADGLVTTERAKGQLAPKEKPDAVALASFCTSSLKIIAAATSKMVLSQWWRDAKDNREAAETAMPNEYQKVLDAFDDKMTVLSKEAA